MVKVHPDGRYTAKQVAEILDLHPDTVYRMGKRGVLETVKVGPRYGLTRFTGRSVIAHREGRDG